MDLVLISFWSIATTIVILAAMDHFYRWICPNCENDFSLNLNLKNVFRIQSLFESLWLPRCRQLAGLPSG